MCVIRVLPTTYIFKKFILDKPSTNFYQEKKEEIWLSPMTKRKKGRYLIQSYDESPYTDRKIQKAMQQHKNATKNFDYTTIADRLRTISWGDDSRPSCVVKPVYGIPTFPLTTKAV